MGQNRIGENRIGENGIGQNRVSESYAVLLGTKGGPSQRPGSSLPTSHLLVLDDKPIVIDCGLGVTKNLVDQGIQLRDLSLIFISHLHADHYMELGPLLHTAWTSGLRTPVEVYGPPGLADYWQGFLTSMAADIEQRMSDQGRIDLSGLVTIHAMDAGKVLERDGLTVTALRTLHPPLVDCFALSFQTSALHVVYSGDTAPLPALVGFAGGADLLVHEAMLEDALPALMTRLGPGSEKVLQHLLHSHSRVQDAAKTATDAGVKALALCHLIPSDDPTYGPEDWAAAVKGIWDGPLYVGRDGLRIELP